MPPTEDLNLSVGTEITATDVPYGSSYTNGIFMVLMPWEISFRATFRILTVLPWPRPSIRRLEQPTMAFAFQET